MEHGAVRVPLLLALVVVGASSIAAAQPGVVAQPGAVVVAVDTSRSLSQADLETVAAALRRQVTELAAATPCGLLIFHDDAQWLVPAGSTPAAVAQGLSRLRPTGSLTVLHDALFLTARELRTGGVVLLASDGRDEGSATTVEDVAGLCNNNQVRIVATSLGRRVDDRALRRLALLTNGTYVGSLPAGGTALGEALASARQALAATAAAPPERAPATPTAVPAEASSRPEAAAARSPWLLPAIIGLVLVAAFALWLVLRGRGQQVRSCERCGSMLEEWEESCPVCQIKELESAVKTKAIAEVAVPDESVLDPEVFDKAPLSEALERTLVIDEQAVVVVRQSGQAARTYTLPEEQIFAVGRAPQVNTLQLQDPAVSAQHFKLVPKDGEHYVVDLETTNGTLVNGERVKVRRLQPGDVITVGTTEIEYKLSMRRA